MSASFTYTDSPVIVMRPPWPPGARLDASSVPPTSTTPPAVPWTVMSRARTVPVLRIASEYRSPALMTTVSAAMVPVFSTPVACFLRAAATWAAPPSIRTYTCPSTSPMSASAPEVMVTRRALTCPWLATWAPTRCTKSPKIDP